MNKNLLLALPLLAMLAACDTSSSDTPKPQIGGREETKGIRNTREIGVSGDAIADHVDKALDGNDRHNAEMQQRAAELGDTQQPQQ